MNISQQKVVDKINMNTNFYTEEELGIMKPKSTHFTPRQLAHAFPWGIKNNVLEVRRQLTDLVFMFQDTQRTGHWHTDYQNIDAPVHELMTRVAFLDKYLALINNSRGKSADSLVNIQRAKMVPISDYIDFNKAGFALCVWHNEKSGSMKYYPKENKVTCFGCNKSGDVIDVMMEVWGCTLIEAVKRLGV